jgi:HK97 family phage portal protein
MRGLSLDGFTGISPVGYQRETIGFGVALRKYGNRMFKSGANIGGVLEHPDEMSDQAWERLKTSFEEKYSGLDNAHKVLLLEEGTKFTVTGMKADEAQFLQSRKFSRSEIAGIYRVPPHMIGDLDRATFTNIEQQSLDYVQNGLLGRARRLEARMAMSLLSDTERETIFIEHLLDGLLRGDFQTRMRGYQVAILSGWMTRNQVRELENQNPGPAELDEYLAPLNMATADKLDPTQEEQVPAPPTNDPSSDPNLDNRKHLHAI